jgi:hypothetical protein
VDDNADDKEKGANDGANQGTVLTSEEKQHDKVPFWLIRVVAIRRE